MELKKKKKANFLKREGENTPMKFRDYKKARCIIKRNTDHLNLNMNMALSDVA